MAYLKKRENMKKLTKSLESYLLAIFKLSKENKKVTVKDVSKLLNHNVQSTTEAIQRLHKHGFIEYLPYKGIKPLIPMNKYIKTYFEREKTIKDFLKSSCWLKMISFKKFLRIYSLELMIISMKGLIRF